LREILSFGRKKNKNWTGRSILKEGECYDLDFYLSFY
jgi:hypothetical protein